MSIRRIKRVNLNGARKDLRKTRKTKLNYELSPERDDAIEAKKEKELMDQRFLAWQTDFINRRKTPDQIIDALNHLCSIVEDTIKSSPELRASTLDIIYQKIQTQANLNDIIKTSFVNVEGQCVCHRTLKAAKIPLKAWHIKSFDLECDSCGYKLPASECQVVKGKK
jgi:hypothetical protein